MGQLVIRLNSKKTSRESMNTEKGLMAEDHSAPIGGRRHTRLREQKK